MGLFNEQKSKNGNVKKIKPFVSMAESNSEVCSYDILETVMGYAIFHDVENTKLRWNNRANVIINIFEDNYRKNKLTFKGKKILDAYTEAMGSEGNNPNFQKLLLKTIKERGYSLDIVK